MYTTNVVLAKQYSVIVDVYIHMLQVIYTIHGSFRHAPWLVHVGTVRIQIGRFILLTFSK